MRYCLTAQTFTHDTWLAIKRQLEPTNLTKTNAYGENAAHKLAQNSSCTVEALEALRSVIGVNMEERNRFGQTLLHVMLKCNSKLDLAVLQWLIKALTPEKDASDIMNALKNPLVTRKVIELLFKHKTHELTVEEKQTFLITYVRGKKCPLDIEIIRLLV